MFSTNSKSPKRDTRIREKTNKKNNLQLLFFANRVSHMVIICCRWGTIVLLRWVRELCILCNSRFCICILGRSRVRGRTVHDRAQWSEGISGLSGHIWCFLGGFVPGPSVVRDRAIRDWAEWSRVVPGRSGHAWCCKENGPQAIWLNKFWCLMINTTCGQMCLLVFMFVVHMMLMLLGPRH
jgi:hypothetical protein